MTCHRSPAVTRLMARWSSQWHFVGGPINSCVIRLIRPCRRRRPPTVVLIHVDDDGWLAMGHAFSKCRVEFQILQLKL